MNKTFSIMLSVADRKWITDIPDGGNAFNRDCTLGSNCKDLYRKSTNELTELLEELRATSVWGHAVCLCACVWKWKTRGCKSFSSIGRDCGAPNYVRLSSLPFPCKVIRALRPLLCLLARAGPSSKGPRWAGPDNPSSELSPPHAAHFLFLLCSRDHLLVLACCRAKA